MILNFICNSFIINSLQIPYKFISFLFAFYFPSLYTFGETKRPRVGIKLKNMIQTFPKYKQNLRRVNDEIWSYTTHVATIKGDELHQLGWWSVTTQKHINYAANELGLTLVR